MGKAIGTLLWIVTGAIVIYLFAFLLPNHLSSYTYTYSEISTSTVITDTVTHLPTPKQVKAIYITSWLAGGELAMEKLVKLIDETEINSVVIDIKDYTGRISFVTNNKIFNNSGVEQERIKNIKDLIRHLHDKNIYVIGRISSFQDAFMVSARPDLAVKTKSDGKVWKDYKGISWLDPGSEEVWKYLVLIGKESYDLGFDELNFDYIRFPSDGNMKDIKYSFGGNDTKANIIKNFFAYLDKELHGTGAVLSADLFGMTTTNKDDMNIGQLLENALPYMDYVAPMVYPSHYPATFMGFANPSTKPYEVVKFSMDKAVARAVVASTSPLKLRPWLQDFSIGHTDYTPEMVRAQIKATYDSGLDSWMLWNASSKYSASALLPN